MSSRPLTVAMTPSFWDDEHMLLRTQLKCLSRQTCRDFDVMLVDPHYRKRKDVIPELAEMYGLEIIHVPYEPAQHIAKAFDCAIFNAAYCYSSSPRIVRYSCYRFVTPNFVERMLTVSPGVNIDMYSLNVGPCLIEERDGLPLEKHKTVWDFRSDEVNWDAIPGGFGVGTDGRFVGDPNLSLARWQPYCEVETEVIPVPLNCYGNIMWWRENWLAVNGADEALTNSAHWEDIDFDSRTNTAGQAVVRIPRLMFRLHHTYGGFSQRSNAEVDVPLVRPCATCCQFTRLAIPSVSLDVRAGLCRERYTSLGETTLYEGGRIWVCNTCGLSGPVWTGDEMEYVSHAAEIGRIRATIIPEVKIGRNLRVLADDMDGLSTVAEKFEVYQRSWTDERYYVRGEVDGQG